MTIFSRQLFTFNSLEPHYCNVKTVYCHYNVYIYHGCCYTFVTLLLIHAYIYIYIYIYTCVWDRCPQRSVPCPQQSSTGWDARHPRQGSQHQSAPLIGTEDTGVMPSWQLHHPDGGSRQRPQAVHTARRWKDRAITMQIILLIYICMQISPGVTQMTPFQIFKQGSELT